MAHIYVKSEKVVNANPANVYSVLSDYREQRPHMLPPNFVDYKVERGGHGEGTEVSYRLHVARRERPYHMRIKEPVKGKVITENDTNSSLVTTWTLLPLDDSQRTMVRVATEWEGGRGLRGFFERTFAPLGVRRLYGYLLNQLSTIAPATTTQSARTNHSSADFLKNGENPATNLSMFLLIFGSVIGLSFGIDALSKRFARQ
jgi:hypothetical protein